MIAVQLLQPKQSWGRVMDWWRQYTTATERDLLAALASHDYPNGCNPTVRELATMCGISRRQVFKLLRRLSACGLITITHYPPQAASYWIQYDREAYCELQGTVDCELQGTVGTFANSWPSKEARRAGEPVPSLELKTRYEREPSQAPATLGSTQGEGGSRIDIEGSEMAQDERKVVSMADKTLRKHKGAQEGVRPRNGGETTGSLSVAGATNPPTPLKGGPARELLYWFSTTFRVALVKDSNGRIPKHDLNVAQQLINTYGSGVQKACWRAHAMRNDNELSFDGKRFTIHKVLRYMLKCDESLDEAVAFPDEVLLALPKSDVHRFIGRANLLARFTRLHGMTEDDVKRELFA